MVAIKTAQNPTNARFPPLNIWPKASTNGIGSEHLHKAGVVVAVYVAPIDRPKAVEPRTMDPKDFAVVGQLLGQSKKSIEGPEDDHYQGEHSASIFVSDAFCRY